MTRSRARCVRSITLATALILSATGLSLAQIVEKPIPGDPVTTDAGLIAGKVLESGVHAYLGVPFAKPPVRELRWAAPEPRDAWKGVYNADRFAPECMQTLRNSDINHYFGEEALSEDCLYLNIWAPETAEPGADLPVVVWIYGGGFNVGSTNMANYAGEQLAQEGVIYVAIAYRLGAMGFMAHPELAKESETGTSGNYGLMDQILGLQWVADNIEAFGGDPDNVTIVGQSAGSMSLSALQVSPQAEGLFDKVFGMSGSIVNGFSTPYEVAEEAGLKAQEQLGAETLDELRAISSDKFLDLEGVRFSLAVDGHVLPQPAQEAFEQGSFADVPMVIGFTKDETFNGVAGATDLGDLAARAEGEFGDRADEILEIYGAETADNFRRLAVDISRDSSMASSVRDWAIAQTEHGDAPVYAYMFSRTQPYTEGVTFADHDPATVGAYHTVEVPYFLDTLESLNMFRTTRTWTEADLQLRDDASGALVAFAKTGDPSANFEWPEYTLEDELIVEFDAGDIQTIEWPNREAMKIFHELRTAD